VSTSPWCRGVIEEIAEKPCEESRRQFESRWRESEDQIGVGDEFTCGELRDQDGENEGDV